MFLWVCLFSFWIWGQISVSPHIGSTFMWQIGPMMQDFKGKGAGGSKRMCTSGSTIIRKHRGHGGGSRGQVERTLHVLVSPWLHQPTKSWESTTWPWNVQGAAVHPQLCPRCCDKALAAGQETTFYWLAHQASPLLLSSLGVMMQKVSHRSKMGPTSWWVVPCFPAKKHRLNQWVIAETQQ